MKEEQRAYRRALALYCLAGPKKNCPSMTAAELCELMHATAEAEGHPKDCYRGISPASVAGFLAALERNGEASRVGERHNGRNGRPEPLWQRAPIAGELESVPEPPGHRPDQDPEPETTTTSAMDYAHLDRRQLEAVASAQDVLLVALSHHVVDPRRSLTHLEPARAQAREILRAAGLEVEA